MSLHPLSLDDPFPSRIRRHGALRLLFKPVSSIPPPDYRDHAPHTNRAAIDQAHAAFDALTQASSQNAGQSAWNATAYARYISAKAQAVAEDAARARARIRLKPHRRQNHLRP